MRKVILWATVLCMTVLLFAGCGGDSSDGKAPSQKTNMVYATGGTSGTYYPLGGAMAQIWNTKADNVNVTAQATGASIENLRLLESDEAELAIVQSDTIDYAVKGIEVFNDKLVNVRAIAYMYPEVIQVVVRADSGIESIADLRGKKVGVGAPGSGTEANFRQLIDVAGLTYDDLSPQYLSFSESSDQFKDSHIDAFIVVAGIPNSAIMDISTQHEIKIINFSDDMLAKVAEKYPFLKAIAIPAGTYRGIDSETKTVAVMATLAVSASVSDDVVYNLTKVMFENLSDLAAVNAKGKEIELENAVSGMTVPLHPGAEKYFKEKGVLK
jgi:TRAP transporter solute receptor, TAXI family